MPPPAQQATGWLPAELTSFVGRRQEITETRRLLGTAHLVTLTGPGGVGKTRLALRVASGLQRSFPDGVRLVELAELRDPALLATTMADKLGVRDRSSRPPVEALVDHLGTRRVLLVLDNCEHLVDACAQVVELLLRVCPNLRILATSRQSLGVSGEATLPIAPLPVPDGAGIPDQGNGDRLAAAWVGNGVTPGRGGAGTGLRGGNGSGHRGATGTGLRGGNGATGAGRSGIAGAGAGSAGNVQNCDAVQMFVDRAHAVVPTFRLDERNTARVARVCRALDGLPLAIELAAVRLRVLSLDELEDRLEARYRLLTSGSRNAPARQQTLRAAIDWSYELCSPAEQLMWARLSVFSGGFDLEAAENVCAGDGIEADAVLDIIDALVDKSVVMHEEADGRARYKLLETIREYGHEKLAEAGQVEQLRRRHRDWYDVLTAAFEREWLGPDQIAWVSRLRREHANLRVALDYCATTAGEARTGLRIATRLDDYWGILGLHTEARHWLDGALAVSPDPTPERVSGLRMSGWFALLQGDVERARQLLDSAAALAARTNDRAEAAYVQHAYGLAALFAGDLGTAQVLIGQALSAFRDAKVLRGELFCLFIGGLTLGGNGDPRGGLALIEQCMALSERQRDVFWRSYALWARAYLIVITTGDYDRAAAAAREAVGYKRQLYDHLGLAFAVDTLAWVAERLGQHKRAAVLFGAAHTIWQALGASPANYAVFADLHDRHVGLTRSALGEDAYEDAFRHGVGMSTEAALDYALEEETVDQRREPAAASAGPGSAGPGSAGPGSASAGSASAASAGLASAGPAGSLTRREWQIAELIANGMTNREIAQTLVIAIRTAEGHVEHILSKLGFSSRTQVAAWVTSQRLAEQLPERPPLRP